MNSPQLQGRAEDFSLHLALLRKPGRDADRSRNLKQQADSRTYSCSCPEKNERRVKFDSGWEWLPWVTESDRGLPLGYRTATGECTLTADWHGGPHRWLTRPLTPRGAKSAKGAILLSDA